MVMNYSQKKVTGDFSMSGPRLTPKERVLKAIEHQEPDRVPIDCWMTEAAKENLRNYFDLSPENDPYESWHSGVLEIFRVDLRWPKLPYIGRPLKKFSDGSWESEWGVIRKGYGGGVPITHPLRDATSVEQIEKYTYPVPELYDYSGLEDYCQRNAQYALIGGSYFPFFTQSCTLMSMDRVMTNLYDAPVLVEALMNKLVDVHIALTEKWLESAPNQIDILLCTDDYGSTQDLLLSPQHWRKYIKPILQRVIDYAHANGLKFMLHSDGAIRKIIPDLIDMGVDILNPIESDARDMEPLGIKRNFGDHIAFHGAVSSVSLAQGSPEQIAEEVKRLLQHMGEGGGFIINSCNQLMVDMPVENILTMYDCAYQYGWYS
jgi:uroporphyrinogen decarboxylase